MAGKSVRRLLALAACALTASGERVVAVGDVHGDYGRFTAVLRAARILDARAHWTGGRATLVQLGDFLDRGPDSRRVIELLMALEREAPRTGGRVVTLLGNHEAMNVYGDLRYVSPEEFASYRTPQSAARRERLFQQVLAEARRAGVRMDETDLRAEWEPEHPLGWIEHREAFDENGVYGKWIRLLPAVVKLGDTLFVHGGISARYLDWPIPKLNARVREELADFALLDDGIVMDHQGPLWFGGVIMDAAAIAVRHDVRRVVAGHITYRAGVRVAAGGKLVLIDTGLAGVYGGRACALVLEDGRLSAIDERAAPCVAPLN